MKTRDEMIDLLIDADINNFFDRDDMEDYLAYLLRTGIKGYEQYTKLDLYLELVDREIIEVES